MKLFSILICSILLSSIVVTDIVVSYEPSKAETEKFLKSKINGCEDIDFSMKLHAPDGTSHFDLHFYQKIDFNNGEMIFNVTRRLIAMGPGIGMNDDETDYNYKVSLNKLDYDDVAVGKRSPQGMDEVNRTAVELRCLDENCISDNKSSLVIFTCTQDIAPRLQKAFSHLIKLNGGTTSPF